jgi:hypothetical protein
VRCTPKCTEHTEIPGFDDYGCHPREGSSLKRFFLSFVMQGLFPDIYRPGAGKVERTWARIEQWFCF